MFSPDGRSIVSGSHDRTVRVWDITEGSSKILAIADVPDNADARVWSVAISSDGRLVAAGCSDAVCDFWLFVGVYSEYTHCRWCVSGTSILENCWRGYEDTQSVYTVWHSPPMDVEW